MNNMNINGKNYNVQGNNIVVKNGTVYVDGVFVEGDLSGDVKIEFFGDVASLDCTSATIHGNVEGNVNCTSIKCGDVGGSVNCTSIKCNDVGGNVKGMSVKCNSMNNKNI